MKKSAGKLIDKYYQIQKERFIIPGASKLFLKRPDNLYLQLCRLEGLSVAASELGVAVGTQSQTIYIQIGVAVFYL